MKGQSGPYRASETIDTADVLHIGGVLYAGELICPMCCLIADLWISCDGYCEDCDRYSALVPTDTSVDLCRTGSIRPCSPASPGSIRQGAGGDRPEDGGRPTRRLRRSGLPSLL